MGFEKEASGRANVALREIDAASWPEKYAPAAIEGASSALGDASSPIDAALFSMNAASSPTSETFGGRSVASTLLEAAFVGPNARAKLLASTFEVQGGSFVAVHSASLERPRSRPRRERRPSASRANQGR